MSNKLKRSDKHKVSHLLELKNISSALRRLATATSDQLGSDCYMHSALAQTILTRLGIDSTLVVGYAAWRVGKNDPDVILHAPIPGMPPQPGVAYHVWLESSNRILDFTTYQLKRKARQLDELDGGTTTVTWSPDFLAVPKKSISPLHDVIQLRAGLYHYTHVPALHERIVAAAHPLDGHDVAVAWHLYRNPDLAIFGPCSVPL